MILQKLVYPHCVTFNKIAYSTKKNPQCGIETRFVKCLLHISNFTCYAVVPEEQKFFFANFTLD